MLDWKEKTADKWWRVKVADHALQTMKDAVEFNTIARLTKKQQDGTLGKQTQERDALGDMYLGDVHKTSSVSTALTSGLLGAVVAVGAAWWLSQPDTPTAPPTTPPVEPSPEVNIPSFNQQGFVIKPGAPEGWGQ